MNYNRYITQFPKYTAYLLDGKVYVGGVMKAIKDNEVYEKPNEIKFPKGTQIVQVSYGWYHFIALDSKGYIWSWGTESYGITFGQLGQGKHIVPTETPIKIENIPKMKKVCCGMNHNICLDIYNNLWGFGKNDDYQTGFGDSKSNQYKPIKVKEGVSDIYVGKHSNTTFIITMINEVEAIGNNYYGNVGIGTKSFNVGRSFVSVKSLNGKGKISKIDSNSRSTFCLYENGDIYATGRVAYNGRSNTSKEFFKIDKKHNIIDLACMDCISTIFLTKQGEVYISKHNLKNRNTILEPWKNLNITLPKNIKEKLRNFIINGVYLRHTLNKMVLVWCTPRVIKKKKEMKDCSHCKKKITIGKEFKYKRKKREEKFNFHFECLRELSEDFQEEIKNKMKRDLL